MADAEYMQKVLMERWGSPTQSGENPTEALGQQSDEDEVVEVLPPPPSVLDVSSSRIHVIDTTLSMTWVYVVYSIIMLVDRNHK